ncbi:hypothetical protein GCM10010095_19990 [Streptomyces anthocyanicus]|uniref:DUF317 domain-containing protein n=1 Tax=Streptomyces anthocyanicus TaxID=68174 RepID=UPI0016703E85|nr:DUF317 domain-containing protein [Streptomyces anthocyanicus]GGL34664.1 hypothetical protein GCM10010095_19990 [Streptomyces anthocyanicus]
MLHDDHDTIDGDVFVSPRHLALSTAVGDPGLDPLHDLGWDLHHDDLGNTYLTAPDGKVRLGYLPEGDDDGLWRINAYNDAFGPPTWGVCFNDSATTELVTAFTTALAEAYQRDPGHYLARPLAGSADRAPFLAVDPLINRGWQFNRPDLSTFAITAPDGLATLEYTTGELDPAIELDPRDARWHLWVGTSSARPFWYATASTDTPAALLRAVTESVADPAPLPRWKESTDSYVKDYAQLTPILPPRPPSPTPLDVRRATASRRPAALPAASVPRWSTTSRPAPPGQRR